MSVIGDRVVQIGQSDNNGSDRVNVRHDGAVHSVNACILRSWIRTIRKTNDSSESSIVNEQLRRICSRWHCGETGCRSIASNILDGIHRKLNRKGRWVLRARKEVIVFARCVVG